MSFSSWRMTYGHHWAAMGTLWSNLQTLTSWLPKAKFSSMRTHRSVTVWHSQSSGTFLSSISFGLHGFELFKVVPPPHPPPFFFFTTPLLSKLCVHPVGRPCWPVAGQTPPGSMTSTPIGESSLETTPPCHSTLNPKATSPCLWARYFIQVSNTELKVGMGRCVIKKVKVKISHVACAYRVANLGSDTEISAEMFALNL